MPITPMRAHRMAIMGLIGSMAASSSAQDPGITAAGMVDVAGAGAAAMQSARVALMAHAEAMRRAEPTVVGRGVASAALGAELLLPEVHLLHAAASAAEVTSVAAATWVVVAMAADIADLCLSSLLQCPPASAGGHWRICSVET